MSGQVDRTVEEKLKTANAAFIQEQERMNRVIEEIREAITSVQSGNLAELMEKLNQNRVANDESAKRNEANIAAIRVTDVHTA